MAKALTGIAIGYTVFARATDDLNVVPVLVLFAIALVAYALEHR